MCKKETNQIKWNLFSLLILSFTGIVILMINLLFVMPTGVTEVSGEVYTDQKIEVIDNKLEGLQILRVNDTSNPYSKTIK